MQLSNRITFRTLTLQANNAHARLQYDVIRERPDKIILRMKLNTASLDSVSFDTYISFRGLFPIAKKLFPPNYTIIFAIHDIQVCLTNC